MKKNGRFLFFSHLVISEASYLVEEAPIIVAVLVCFFLLLEPVLLVEGPLLFPPPLADEVQCRCRPQQLPSQGRSGFGEYTDISSSLFGEEYIFSCNYLVNIYIFLVIIW